MRREQPPEGTRTSSAVISKVKPNRRSSTATPVADRFQVQLLIDETGLYASYTSPKHPVTREMAEALGRGLQRGNARGNTGGRIVDLATGEVINSWPRRSA